PAHARQLLRGAQAAKAATDDHDVTRGGRGGHRWAVYPVPAPGPELRSGRQEPGEGKEARKEHEGGGPTSARRRSERTSEEVRRALGGGPKRAREDSGGGLRGGLGRGA